MEVSDYGEVIATLEGLVKELHTKAYKIVESHWMYIREMEGRLPGWENKSKLQVRCAKLEGNSIRVDWCEIKWYGSKAKGDRKSIRVHIVKPKGSHLYTLTKLKALARDWEAAKVEETEYRLSDIRREASHLVKAIISIRNARLAATRNGKVEDRQ